MRTEPYKIEELPENIQVMVKEVQARQSNALRLYDENKKELGVIEFMNEKINQAIIDWEKTKPTLVPVKPKEVINVNAEKV